MSTAVLPLLDLPEDVLLSILSNLPISGLSCMRQTCKALADISPAHCLWSPHLAQLDKSGYAIPTSRKAIIYDGYEAPETSVRRALQLSKTFNCPQPQPAQITNFALSLGQNQDQSEHGQAMMHETRFLHPIDLLFVPGWNGRLLFTSHLVAQDAPPPGSSGRAWILRVWDLFSHHEVISEGQNEEMKTPSGQAKCITTFHVPARVGIALDQDTNYEGSRRVRIAMFEHLPDRLTVYELVPNHVSKVNAGFKPLASYPGVLFPMNFEGDTIVARDENECLVLLHLFEDVSNMEASDTESLGDGSCKLVPYAKLEDDEMSVQPPSSMRVYLGETCIIDFRPRTIAVYARPAPPSEFEPVSETPVHVLSTLEKSTPLATHRFQWRLYDISVRARACPPSHLPILDLFLRFDSYLPWPVNMLHHLLLLPSNRSRAYPFDTSTSSPYNPVPKQSGAWPSHVALFARADLCIGSKGTAVWLDSDGDGASEQAAGNKQRVAGRRLYAHGPRLNEDEEETSDRLTFGTQVWDGVLRVEGSESTAESTAQDEDEQPPSPATPAAEHPTEGEGEGGLCVFDIQESVDSRDWCKLAVCEEEGLLAMMSAEGKVEVRGYAPVA